MTQKPKDSFAERSRQSLMRRANAARLALAARAVRPAAPRATGATDFLTLPGYGDVRVYQRIADLLGISNPFFRLHEGRASAETQIGGRALVNFSSYDYLGLNGHPAVAAAAKAAIDRYGISSSASRCVGGERPVHLRLERAIADHYGVESAVAFVSGYATNVGVIGQLVGPKDLVVLDSVIHNSAVIGGVLSTANRRSFPHNDLDALDELLRQHRGKFERALIVVEGVYSMDGDYPDLPRLIEIKRRHEAWLMVDEAHALGVLGKTGHGLAEHFGVEGSAVDIWMGTLSKTLAACGGYIAGSEELVYYLKNFVGAFVYSVAMPPSIAAAAEAALACMHQEPERVERLQSNAAFFLRAARARGLDTGSAAGTAVSPIIAGDSLPAVFVSEALFRRGFNVLPIIYPAVPAKAARLRFFVSAMHSESDIERALDATVEEMAAAIERMSTLRLPDISALQGTG